MTTTTVREEAREVSTRPVRRCAKCGEKAGSISKRTGRPLHREADGRFFHIGCRPGAMSLGMALTAFEGMGA
ncbi:MAG: hypothetical protein M3R38_02375 [Actinomycetota bacterium]|nr:hypothetical protein [Actinomycetota bacterium]